MPPVLQRGRFPCAQHAFVNSRPGSRGLVRAPPRLAFSFPSSRLRRGFSGARQERPGRRAPGALAPLPGLRFHFLFRGSGGRRQRREGELVASRITPQVQRAGPQGTPRGAVAGLEKGFPGNLRMPAGEARRLLACGGGERGRGTPGRGESWDRGPGPRGGAVLGDQPSLARVLLGRENAGGSGPVRLFRAFSRPRRFPTRRSLPAVHASPLGSCQPPDPPRFASGAKWRGRGGRRVRLRRVPWG